MGFTRRNAMLAAGAALVAPAARAADGVLVAAAADLQLAMPELIRVYEAGGGSAVRVTFGATGNLARQIRQGLPIALFMAADENFIAGLVRDGVIPDAGVVYAEGRLGLIINKSSPLAGNPSIEAVAAAIVAGKIGRFAIANPEHAPYGQRAREVIERLGLAPALEGRLVLGENVAQAAQFVMTGAADAGLVSRSHAGAEVTQKVAIAVDIAPDWHSPLLQRMALTTRAGEDARRLFAFLQGPAARTIFSRHGFRLPGEAG
jgi:molybdate transport system substrate-binding protein